MGESVRERAMAYFGGQLATDLAEVVDLVEHPDVLDHGWWAVAGSFEGELTGYRFDSVCPAPLPAAQGPWRGPASWASSLDLEQFRDRVRQIQARIAAGEVYQVNLCRMLTAELDEQDRRAGPLPLATALTRRHPAPGEGLLHTGSEWIVTASPELFLQRTGDRVVSAPIKGTAAAGEPFLAKDYPENIMITDLVRNDLGRVAWPGTVRVEALAAAEDHPGLRHLVSVVSAQLLPGTGWGELLAATFPPGSVSGAPKHTALQAIRDLEPVPRGIYCGAIGFVDGDRGLARLSVAIRTFFTSDDATRLHFGTGAGITYPSDPDGEWAETELKAARLMAVASPGRPEP